MWWAANREAAANFHVKLKATLYGVLPRGPTVTAEARGEGPGIANIDHFFPHPLMLRGLPLDLDPPSNLVLACTTCN